MWFSKDKQKTCCNYSKEDCAVYREKLKSSLTGLTEASAKIDDLLKSKADLGERLGRVEGVAATLNSQDLDKRVTKNEDNIGRIIKALEKTQEIASNTVLQLAENKTSTSKSIHITNKVEQIIYMVIQGLVMLVVFKYILKDIAV